MLMDLPYRILKGSLESRQAKVDQLKKDLDHWEQECARGQAKVVDIQTEIAQIEDEIVEIAMGRDIVHKHLETLRVQREEESRIKRASPNVEAGLKLVDEIIRNSVPESDLVKALRRIMTFDQSRNRTFLEKNTLYLPLDELDDAHRGYLETGKVFMQQVAAAALGTPAKVVCVLAGDGND